MAAERLKHSQLNAAQQNLRLPVAAGEVLQLPRLLDQIFG